jgi:hypothetical protein
MPSVKEGIGRNRGRRHYILRFTKKFYEIGQRIQRRNIVSLEALFFRQGSLNFERDCTSLSFLNLSHHLIIGINSRSGRAVG